MRKSWLLVIIAILAIGALIPVAAFAQSAPPASPSATTPMPYIGISVAPNSEAVAARLGVDKSVQGLVVIRVLADSPAATGGLREKDIITKVGSTAATTVASLTDAVKAAGVGDTVQLMINRAGAPQTVSVMLAARPVPGPRVQLAQGAKRLPHFPFPHFGFFGKDGGKLHSANAEWENKDGQTQSMSAVAGAVSAKGANSLTVKPNGNGAAQTVTIDANAKILKGKDTITLEQVAVGDQVVVVKHNSDTVIHVGPFPQPPIRPAPAKTTQAFRERIEGLKGRIQQERHQQAPAKAAANGPI